MQALVNQNISCSGALLQLLHKNVLGSTTLGCGYAGGTHPEFAIVSRDGLCIMLKLVPASTEIVPNEHQKALGTSFFG
jgi:hypothetical protein